MKTLNIVDHMMELTRTKSLQSLGEFCGKDASTIYRWRKKNHVPNEYLQKAEEYDRLLKEAYCAIDSISVSQVEVAEAFGIDPQNIWKKKKSNSAQYDLIVLGVKMQKSLNKQQAKI